MLQDRFTKNISSLTNQQIPNHIAIAVSGGADSIALAMLTIGWAKAHNIQVTILTVNHNLRSNSANEVLFVEQFAQKFNCDFAALDWHIGEKSNNIQARARAGRYQLMTDYCKSRGITALLTGHHQDDMIETFLMRKSRKAGIFGLSSSYIYFANNIKIIRPLFNLGKQELINYLQGQNIRWIEDESNASDKYARNKVRKDIATLNNEEKNKIITEIKEVNNQAHKLNGELIMAIAEIVKLNNYGFATINLTKFRSQKSDIQIQLLNYVLTIISGKTTVPRYRNLEKILIRINKKNKIAVTLHSCILQETNDTLLIYKEKNFISTNSIILTKQVLWDNRFKIQLVNSQMNDCHICRLSIHDYSHIRKKIDLTKLAIAGNNYHKKILFTLPVIKRLEKVIAIPHISYYGSQDFKDTIKVVFYPDFVSRFTHFSQELI